MYTIPHVPSTYFLRLHCTEGASDKIYEIEIISVGDHWKTSARWGRRGGALQSADKTKIVDFHKASAVAEDLARQKTAKGYRVVSEQAVPKSTHSGTPPAAAADLPAARPMPRPAPTPKSPEAPAPQLASPAAAGTIDMLIASEDYVAQEKFFGERRILVKKGDAVYGFSRRRTPVEVVPAIAEAACASNASFVLDTEIIGDALYAFDLLSFNDADLTRVPLDYRLARLFLLGLELGPAITTVYTAASATDKRKLHDEVRSRDGEGLVFKKRHGLYVPGRPAGDPGWIKYKFHDMLSAIVIGHNEQRSVALGLIDDATGAQIPVGNVTIPVNHEVPPLGAVVEVRYLFAYDNGSLYEPVYLGPRNDICTDECFASQRKFKPPVAA
ncbi:MAG TPA: WGR domain-containing protein [Beijerinckiaceae bacterium]|nr:WGR domain-containing protein [Hyphomicrobiales bacterium]HRY04940.1 WGR domain-containing protein [Beijerinckiaceae bacterium]